MSNINKLIPERILKFVAKENGAKYPETFGNVDDDGVTLGDGSSTLYNRLYKRAFYLTRPHKRLQCAERFTPHRLFKKKEERFCRLFKLGARLYSISENTTAKDAVNTYLHAKRISTGLLELLKKIYTNQRAFLNNIANPPSVIEIKREWPIIFNELCIKWHFEKLTEKNLHWRIVFSQKQKK
ncbi:hypothetical protein AMK59_2367 [Oryctes borbonicus]|uniref:Uncharacterized protein n=1 Tax=Oryctes borbonicus TaxID=1629725 RepID=A0A0T6B9L2_9SCAR|nr:hypothetical protein AMK59_2367 [Oryctes borbonicus]